LGKEVIDYDNGRTHDLKKLGIKTLRFTNNQVFKEMKTLLQEISIAVSSLSPLYSLSRFGRKVEGKKMK
jgi:very-short-patch-repair endonuclease